MHPKSDERGGGPNWGCLLPLLLVLGAMILMSGVEHMDCKPGDKECDAHSHELADPFHKFGEPVGGEH